MERIFYRSLETIPNIYSLSQFKNERNKDAFLVATNTQLLVL